MPTGDFDWAQTTALNEAVFTRRYRSQPLWVRLTPIDDDGSKVSGRARKAALRRAAHGAAANALDMPAESIAGDERRRTLWQRTLAGLVVLALAIAGYFTVNALTSAHMGAALDLEWSGSTDLTSPAIA